MVSTHIPQKCPNTGEEIIPNCPFCGVESNDSWAGVWFFYECGNAYDDVALIWTDSCCNEVTFP